ncbi:MAG: antibiotic biosynthesis monooxygenase [Ilumatobacteraceae bacterium]
MADGTVIIAGWIDVEPASRDDLVAASIPFQRSTRDDEPGCDAYVFAADPAVAGRIAVFEQWATAADLDAHFVHPNFLGMKELLRAYPRVGSQTTKFRVDASGPVYGPDGVPSATDWPAG